MRIQCDLPGYEACYLDVVEMWTRGEIKRFWSAALQEDDGSLLRNKTVGVHLVTADGMIIDEPDELIDEVLDGLPYELYVWLSTAYGHAINELQALAKKNVRQSFDTSAAKT